MKKALILLILTFSLPALSQTKDPNVVLNSLKSKYSGIKDYTVDARILVDVAFLKMAEKQARIYYKYPDKVHIETEGFALLPKRAASFDPASFIGSDFTAVYIRNEKWGNTVVDVIKTIPHDPESDVILNTFWIDPVKKQILQFEINSKSGGAFQVVFEYNNQPFDLPQRLTVNFDIKDMNMPKTATGEINVSDKKKGAAKTNKGKVTITYSNYKVNTGLDDKLFSEKKKGK
ncbi:MAG TPA: hypothetical protein PK796_02685 [Bacteroidales bacterium]|nr:hypothetical protein [Bacteroidales bacterium]